MTGEQRGDYADIEGRVLSTLPNNTFGPMSGTADLSLASKVASGACGTPIAGRPRR
jgi:hypothetical protein